MSKIYRNMSTPESRAFWNTLEQRVGEHEFQEKYGCSTYTHWKIRWCMMWEMIGLCAIETKATFSRGPKLIYSIPESRWHYLEVD